MDFIFLVNGDVHEERFYANQFEALFVSAWSKSFSNEGKWRRATGLVNADGEDDKDEGEGGKEGGEGEAKQSAAAEPPAIEEYLKAVGVHNFEEPLGHFVFMVCGRMSSVKSVRCICEGQPEILLSQIS
jgi:hypothetical protein